VVSELQLRADPAPKERAPSKANRLARVPFRARARTVDHLGREQIADCPTAVSELWKNAYDAYARAVALHIFDGEIPVAAVVDDGHGMSVDEFIERWLMLGTEAKAGDDEVPEEDRDGLPLRPRQGQKGIGRLSVAYLGPTALILTRRRGGPFVAALLDWRLFQNPYLRLDDVQVPVEELTDTGDLPRIVDRLLEGLVDNLWGSADDPNRRDRLVEAWRRFYPEERVRGEEPSEGRIARLAIGATLQDRVCRRSRRAAALRPILGINSDCKGKGVPALREPNLRPPGCAQSIVFTRPE
jgi:hypothetical protein